nr:11175_t:CDS:10 [Entrophospora candida]
MSTHSLIIDPSDENYIIQNVFMGEELQEIKEFNIKPTPKVPSDLLDYMESYNVDNIIDLRKRINHTVLNILALIIKLILRISFYRLREYENENFTKNHLEAWYTIHLWNFIDKVFEDLNEVEIVRGEPCSIASAERKNMYRTVPAVKSLKCKSMGNCGDMLIRKDQYCSLCKYIDYEEDKFRKFETIAFIHSGMMIMQLRLDSPMGYIYRISQTKTYEIPTQINEFGKKVLPALIVAWKSKMIVRNMIKLVENNDYSKAEYLEYLQDCDEYSEYRHVTLPRQIAQYMPHNRLLTDDEWRSLGIKQSKGWEHYLIHAPEPHILLFKREKFYKQKYLTEQTTEPDNPTTTTTMSTNVNVDNKAL